MQIPPDPAAACDEFFDNDRKLLQLLYHNTREYFLLLDRSLRIRMYNRITWEQVKSHMGFEITRGMSMLQFRKPAEQEELRLLLEEVLQGAVRETFLDVRSRRDGTVISLRNFFLPARDEQDTIVAILVIAHDISAQKRTEQALARSEEQWRFALEGSNLGLWDLDLTNDRYYFSPSYHRLYGFEEKSLRPEARELTERIHPDDYAIMEEALDRHLRGETPMYEVTYRIRDAQESYRWVNDRGMVVARDASGRALRMIGTHNDVTDTVEAERRLQLSEQKYRLLFDSNPLPCLIVDADNLEVIRANPEALRLYGSDGPLLGTSLCRLWQSGLPDGELKRRLELPRVQPQRMTWHYQHAGKHRHIEVYSEPIRFDERAARLVLVKDITEQIETEVALHRSNERFLLATRATSDAIYDWDLETNELLWGEGLSTLFGYSSPEVPVSEWEALIHPADRKRVIDSLHLLMHASREDFWKAEYRFAGKDGRYRHVLDRGYILRSSLRKPTRMIGAMQDVTEQKERERALLEAELERQKQIAQATIETQERERAEIGKELHDNVNQVLTTTKLYLDLALSNGDLREELLGKSSKNIIYVINEIRQLSRSLMNPSLGDLGLSEAVRDLAENIQLTRRLNVELDLDPAVDESLSETQEIALFRILQEAVSNSLRHAGASTLRIALHCAPETVLLTVKDDGTGFEPELVRKGAGLRNIENRVYLANGTLRVESRPRQGCTLIVQLPMKT